MEPVSEHGTSNTGKTSKTQLSEGAGDQTGRAHRDKYLQNLGFVGNKGNICRALEDHHAGELDCMGGSKIWLSGKPPLRRSTFEYESSSMAGQDCGRKCHAFLTHGSN